MYTRVSTDEQAERGYSLKNQKQTIERYAFSKNIEIIKHYEEDYSAKTLDRPEFKKMREYIKSNHKTIDYLIFTKFDRFARNALDTLWMIRELKQKNIDIICIDQPIDLDVPENILTLSIYAAAPEAENARRGLNTMQGMRRAQLEGRWVASAPKGYDNFNINGKKGIKPNDDAIYVRKAFIEVAKGLRPISSIRKELWQEGFRCSSSQFYAMLRNPVYIGKIFIKEWKDEEAQIVNGQHDGIVSDKIFYIVQGIINGINRDRYIRKANSDDLYLRGKLLCHACDKKLTGSASTNRNKKKYHYYHCQNGCKTRFRFEVVNNKLDELIDNLEVKPEILELYCNILIDHFEDQEKETAKVISNYDTKIEELNISITNIENAFARNEIDSKSFNKMKSRFDDEKEKLLMERSSLLNDSRNFKREIVDGLNILNNLPELFRNSNCDTKLLIIGSIFNEKLVFDGENYRTPKFNSVLELLFSNIDGFGRLKQKKANKTISFSDWVAPPGLEPGSIV
ncbi:recombinase family protein [Marinifilum flexuosum]|uniref:recombinase family protein n=1 Tax=Marinifilum flexuosum TaxID=1117708 RepID=UPI003CD0D8DC